MAALNRSGQNVDRKPPPRIFELRLVGERARAVDATEVFRLNQLGPGVDRTHFAHRCGDSTALVQKDARKDTVIASVRIPQTIQAAEACSGERLVHGGVSVDPWIALGESPRECSELAREIR